MLFCFDSAQSRRFRLFAGGEGESAHEGVGGGFFTLTGNSRRKKNGGGTEGGREVGRSGYNYTCAVSPGVRWRERRRQPTVTLTHLPAGGVIGPAAKQSGSKI